MRTEQELKLISDELFGLIKERYGADKVAYFDRFFADYLSKEISSLCSEVLCRKHHLSPLDIVAIYTGPYSELLSKLFGNLAEPPIQAKSPVTPIKKPKNNLRNHLKLMKKDGEGKLSS